ncbi:UNVERIFIED_CONTAM: hypothetical protein Sradi_5097000 [Sesamum radiatum]|uniref:Uncharacterized protein n=1 Tax=Sesamum radiatum TaxID=300843 RepID=A0AAW2M138_SESRA
MKKSKNGTDVQQRCQSVTGWQAHGLTRPPARACACAVWPERLSACVLAGCCACDCVHACTCGRGGARGRQGRLLARAPDGRLGRLVGWNIISKNPLTVILDNNKFNGTNYTDWLHNLRIVLDYENQGYIMNKPLPLTLPDGSSSEECETFERWYADHRKVRSIILASISNNVQKQYDMLDDVDSILQRMKEVYAIPDRHTRYVATKEFFRAKITKGSSVQEHGDKMLSLVEKLEDLKVGLENDTYIDVILQSLPPSYYPFIVNFNMNGLEKSINELINMLVQYKATIKKSALSVLIGEASTSKAKGKRAGCWKRKKGKAMAKTVVVAKDAKSAPVALVGMDKEKKRMGTQQQSKANDICAYCHEKRVLEEELSQSIF